MSDGNVFASKGKAQARFAIYDVARTLQFPPNASAFYYPGGVQGTRFEDFEGMQIVRRLGVQYPNIVWAEREEEYWDSLSEHASKKGIGLYFGDSIGFFNITDRKFHYIGIDTTEVWNQDHNLLFAKMFQRQVPASPSLVYFVSYAKREGKTNEFLYGFGHTSRGVRSLGGDHPITRLTEYWDIPSMPSSFEMQGTELRGDHATKEILNVALHGRGIGGLVSPKKLADAKKSFANKKIGRECRQRTSEQYAGHVVEMNEENKLNFQVATKVGNNDLALAIILNDSSPYYAERIDRFSYTNDSDSPLNVDVFILRQIEKLNLPSRADILSGRADPQNIKIEPKAVIVLEEMKSLIRKLDDLPVRRRL